MKVLLVLAHPERRSLNGSLFDFAINTLKSEGHDVKTSDLYGMNWKAVPDKNDFPHLNAISKDGDEFSADYFKLAAASSEAYKAGHLTQDVNEEIEKLKWADTVILQFPLWWFAEPAILKGWVERAFAAGFAYGTGNTYGAGPMVGKRALISITIGGTPNDFSERGICGPIEDILFPLNHGVLFYTGFEVLEPFYVYSADRVDDNRFAEITKDYARRLTSLSTEAPIAYRPAKGGDYDNRMLRPGLEKPGTQGLRLHIK